LLERPPDLEELSMLADGFVACGRVGVCSCFSFLKENLTGAFLPEVPSLRAAAATATATAVFPKSVLLGAGRLVPLPALLSALATIGLMGRRLGSLWADLTLDIFRGPVFVVRLTLAREVPFVVAPWCLVVGPVDGNCFWSLTFPGVMGDTGHVASALFLLLCSAHWFRENGTLLEAAVCFSMRILSGAIGEMGHRASPLFPNKSFQGRALSFLGGGMLFAGVPVSLPLESLLSLPESEPLPEEVLPALRETTTTGVSFFTVH
jgi:hypothetical protein